MFNEPKQRRLAELVAYKLLGLEVGEWAQESDRDDEIKQLIGELFAEVPAPPPGLETIPMPTYIPPPDHLAACVAGIARHLYRQDIADPDAAEIGLNFDFAPVVERASRALLTQYIEAEAHRMGPVAPPTEPTI